MTKKQELIDQVRKACLAKGFFQITNHGISAELQDAVFEQSRAFFSLPLEEKMRTSLSQYYSAPFSGRRAAERPGMQNQAPTTAATSPSARSPSKRAAQGI
jgi:isopenicillin N synthase-like dioxygenase